MLPRKTMMIFGIKPKTDHEYQKAIKAMGYLLNETSSIHDLLEKMVGLIQQSRDSLNVLSSALSSSLSSQVDILKKMEKFYDLQIKWTEEQNKLQQESGMTDDDKRF